jgi:hypothetical protein
MWNQFLLENGHFAINLIAGLVMLSVFWLYFDVWFSRFTKVEGLKALAFLLLSISYFIHSIYVETTVLPIALLPDAVNSWLYLSLRTLGFGVLIIGQILEPIQTQPDVKGLTAETYQSKLRTFAFMGGVSVSILLILDPILSLIVTILYLRRAFAGLERHLKMVGVAFGFLTLADLLHAGTFFQTSNNPLLFNLVSPFGTTWMLEHVCLLGGSLVLACWVFSYLWKRLLTQLVILAELMILALFLGITVSFSALILNNLSFQSQHELEQEAKVTNLAVESKKNELLSYVKLAAQSPQIIQAVDQKNSAGLASLIDGYFLIDKQSSLIVVDANGQIIARAEDKERVGNSISDDTQFKKALSGQDSSSLISTASPIVPQISLQVATPIEKDKTVIGVVETQMLIDNSFVDQIRGDLEHDVSVYSGKAISATSLINPDNHLRPLGLVEEDPQVKSEVLDKGRSYSAAVEILNTPYFAYFLPLKDVNNKVVGMLSLEEPQSNVLQVAGQTIGLTFVATLLFLLLSLIPVYLASRYLSRQFKR